jgi:uncharacterized protein (DUF488 family)
MTQAVFSAGYEGVSLPALITALHAAGVTHVADVRQLPLSRGAGFSKRMLAASLEAEGIGYTHFKALGTPKEGRSANKEGRLADFWAIVDEALARPEALLAWQVLEGLAAAEATCMLCFCGNEQRCHRLRLRSRFEAKGVEVRGLV